MDFLFNKTIPESSNTTLVIRPAGKTWINGLAQQYCEDYDESTMHSFMNEAEFKNVVSHINDILYNFWPCPLCFCTGYVCCPCTFGLSFTFSYACIKDALTQVYRAIEHYNVSKFQTRQMKLSLHFGFCTSWLQIERLSGNEENNHTHIELVESARTENLDDTI